MSVGRLRQKARKQRPREREKKCKQSLIRHEGILSKGE